MGYVSSDVAMERDGRLRAVILVEGMSDRHALEVLAARHGRRLDEEGIAIVSTGGATNIARFLARFGPRGLDVRSRVCVTWPRRATSGAVSSGTVSVPTCRCRTWRRWGSTGASTIWRTSRSARTVQHPCSTSSRPTASSRRSARCSTNRPQRERSTEEQLRRFMGTRSGRKSRYARLLVETLDLDRIPRPLDRALAHHR